MSVEMIKYVKNRVDKIVIRMMVRLYLLFGRIKHLKGVHVSATISEIGVIKLIPSCSTNG